MLTQALHHCLQCPVLREEEGIDMAVKVVAEAKQELLTQRLMDYLLGDIDATPKVCVKLFVYLKSVHYIFVGC